MGRWTSDAAATDFVAATGIFSLQGTSSTSPCIPVELCDEVLLQPPLAVVHEEPHEGLGHQVSQVVANNVKVVGHQQADHLNLHGIS